MPPSAPYPAELFAPGVRHLVILAHHDDELPYAGLLNRMGPDVRVVWVTNSDGLAHEDSAEPEAYGRARYEESLVALSHLGIREEQVRCFGHSEYALYELFAQMSREKNGAAVPQRFPAIVDEVVADALAFKPDVVWTLAWQGGHPEHDLTHLAAVASVRALEAERGESLPFYELPAYELILVPLRFKPWRREAVHTIGLTPDEEAIKARMLESYPTQERIIGQFRTLVGLYGKLSALRFKPFTFSDFGRTEQFAPVPRDRTYTRSTHVSPRLDYIGEDYLGTPIRFQRTLVRIARHLFA